MAETGGGGVGRVAIPEVPVPIGDGAGGTVSERYRQRHCAVGRTGGETRHRHDRGKTADGIGGVPTVGGGKHRVVRERAGADRRKLHGQIGEAEPGHAECAARYNREWSAGYCRRTVADCSAAGVGDHETDLGRGARHHRPEIVRARRDQDVARAQSRSVDRVDRVPTVARENRPPVERGDCVGRKRDGHGGGLSTGHIVGGTTGDFKWRRARGGATQWQITGVDYRETHRVGLTDGHRPKTEATRINHQMRRVDHGDVIGQRQRVGADRATHRHTHRVGRGGGVGVAHTGGGCVGRVAIPKVPEPIRDGAGGVVGKGDDQWPPTVGRAASEARDRHNRGRAADGIGDVAAVGCGEHDGVGKRTGTERRELHGHVGRAKSRHAVAGARHKRERPAGHRRRPVADGGATGVRHHETNLRGGAGDQQAEIVSGRSDGDAARGQAHATDGVGRVPAGAREDDRVVERCGGLR